MKTRNPKNSQLPEELHGKLHGLAMRHPGNPVGHLGSKPDEFLQGSHLVMERSSTGTFHPLAFHEAVLKKIQRRIDFPTFAFLYDPAKDFPHIELGLKVFFPLSFPRNNPE